LTFPAQVSQVIHDGGSSSWKKKKMSSDLKPVTSSAKPHAACIIVQLFLYMQNIHNHDIQRILNLKLVLFHPKCKVSNYTEQLSITKFFGGGGQNKQTHTLASRY